jgi:alpha-beta hydrolase superfamily lysophospholipase
MPVPSRSLFSSLLSRIRSGGGFVARGSYSTAKHIAKAIGYGVAGGSVVLLVLGVNHLNGRPDLAPWHEIELEHEFTADSGVTDFAAYLELEDQIFAEMDRVFYSNSEKIERPRDSIDRFQAGSLADPRSRDRNWNRTFELAPAGPPIAGALLLHGMSDSPYSLRALGEELRRAGVHVVGLRLPGHGTVPSGLVDFEWEDMDAAVCLAMRHLRQVVADDRPLHLVGYSNGGALSVHYALETLEDPTLPAASGIVLLSPAIGVSPMASLAIWQMRLGHWLGLEKLEWNSILPEYDPYKYGSFAVNAGHQVYRLTTEISAHLDRLQKKDGGKKLRDLPPILAFQSVVDATVSTPALVSGLLARLPAPAEGGHELVLYDINRLVQAEKLLAQDPSPSIERLMTRTESPFAVRLLTNRDPSSPAARWRIRRPGGDPDAGEATTLVWPRAVYSLSHVSLPFAPDDPVYGNGEAPIDLGGPAYPLGGIALRGERGVLQVSAADQLRLRWNPFFPDLARRVGEFVTRGDKSPSPANPGL